MTDTNSNNEDIKIITGNIAEDLERASVNERYNHIQKILDEYETHEIMSINEDTYYKIPTYERGDPEIAVVYDDGTAEAKMFNEFMRNVGNGVLDNIPPEKILDKDMSEELEDEIYTQNNVCYHATTVEYATQIIVSGVLKTRNETRGMSNRSTGNAIFASELHPEGIYGDVTFEIHIDTMVQEGFTPPAGREQPVEDAIIKETIAHKFYIDDYFTEIDPDLSRHTIVFYEDIPLQYLSLDCSESDKQSISDEIDQLHLQNELTEKQYQQAREFIS